MSGDPSVKDPVIFYSEQLTETKIVLLSLKGIQLNFIEEDDVDTLTESVSPHTNRYFLLLLE